MEYKTKKIVKPIQYNANYSGEIINPNPRTITHLHHLHEKRFYPHSSIKPFLEKGYMTRNELKSQIKTICGGMLIPEYKNKPLHIVIIQEGGARFASYVLDTLQQNMDPTQLTQSSIIAKSMDGIKQKDNISIYKTTVNACKDKHVLLIDEISDSGKTLQEIKTELEKEKPLSIETFVMVDRIFKKKTDYADYSCMHLHDSSNRNEQAFLIGEGLDYKNYFRDLSGIYSINTSKLSELDSILNKK